MVASPRSGHLLSDVDPRTLLYNPCSGDECLGTGQQLRGGGGGGELQKEKVACEFLLLRKGGGKSFNHAEGGGGGDIQGFGGSFYALA